MESKPTPERMTLAEIQTALEVEQRRWEQRGIGLSPLHPQAVASQLMDLATRVQALTNLLISAGTINEEELDIEFKTILLNNLRIIRENTPDVGKDKIRQQILDGAKVNINSIKPPWEN